MCRFFLWGNKPARIKWAKLVLPKSIGGIGLPGIQRYYWAVHLTRVVDWKIHERCKGWVGLEYLVSQAELGMVPWLPKENIPPHIHAHPLIGATLQAFDRACTIHKLSSKECPITPLRGNPTFIPGLARNFLAAEWPHREIQARHFFWRRRFKNHKEMAELSNTAKFPFWSYLQLKHYLDNPTRRAHFTRDTTVFESRCTRSSPQSHVISALYASMFGAMLQYSLTTLFRNLL